MYQAIVFKITSEYAIVLTKDSAYKRIKRKNNMYVGQQIYFVDDDLYNKNGESRIIKLSYMIATIAIIMVTLIALPQINTDELYAVVSIDINPSFNMTINSDHQVLSIHPLNPSARKLYSKDYLGQDYFSVINDLIERSEKNNFLNASNNLILLSVTSDKDTAILELDLVEKSKNIETLVNSKIILLESDWDRAMTALESDKSIGKTELVALAEIPENSNLSTQQILEFNDVEEHVVYIEDPVDRALLDKNIERMKNIDLQSPMITNFLARVNDDNMDLEALAEESEEILSHHNLYRETIQVIDELKELNKELHSLDKFIEQAESLINSGSYQAVLDLHEKAKVLLDLETSNLATIREDLLTRLNNVTKNLEKYDDQKVTSFIDSLDLQAALDQLEVQLKQAEALLSSVTNQSKDIDNYGQNKKDDERIENPGQSKKDEKDQDNVDDNKSNDNYGQSKKEDETIDNPGQSKKDDESADEKDQEDNISDQDDAGSPDNYGQSKKEDETIDNPGQSKKDDDTIENPGQSNPNDTSDDNNDDNDNDNDNEDDNDEDDDKSHDNYGQNKKDDNTIENPGQSKKNDASDDDNNDDNDNDNDNDDDDNDENDNDDDDDDNDNDNDDDDNDEDDNDDEDDDKSHDNYGQNKKDDDTIENPGQSKKNDASDDDNNDVNDDDDDDEDDEDDEDDDNDEDDKSHDNYGQNKKDDDTIENPGQSKKKDASDDDNNEEDDEDDEDDDD